jgi:hypothetical protein
MDVPFSQEVEQMLKEEIKQSGAPLGRLSEHARLEEQP